MVGSQLAGSQDLGGHQLPMAGDCQRLVRLRCELAVNSQVSLIVAGDGDAVYLRAGTEQAVLASKRELFSFGSGVWCDGADAVQSMSDTSGSWLKCQVDLSSMVVLEKKKIPQHLNQLPCLDQAVSLKELLMALEDQGEESWLKVFFKVFMSKIM